MKIMPMKRGTTLSFLIKLKDGQRDAYQMAEGDKLILGIKHYLEHKNCLVQKILTVADYNDTLKGYVFKLNPEDTMDFCFDDYYMDVGIQLTSGDFYPITPTYILRIKPIVVKKIVEEPEPEPDPEPEPEPEPEPGLEEPSEEINP